MPLEHDEQRHLTAAEGFVELAMFQEADAELEEIDPFCRQLPEVLAVRVSIYRGLNKWALMQSVAKKLVECDPEEPDWKLKLAYATRRAESIEPAREVLLEALELHPKESIIAFNLACYESQLGNFERAKEHLKQAIELFPKCREMAVDDPDLNPLWEAMGNDTSFG